MPGVRLVTQPPSMDQLIRLPEADALRAHFDAENCRMLFRLLLFCVLAALVLAVVMTMGERYTLLAVPVFNLILIRLLYMLREREVFTRYFGVFLISFLVLQTWLWKAAMVGFGKAAAYSDLVAPLCLLVFRLPSVQLVIPLAAAWIPSVGRNLAQWALDSAQLDYGLVIAQTALTLVVFSIVSSVTRRERRQFLIDRRRELHRHRERRRMEEELGDARKIQLSMLPRREPGISWLDVAGISIPASEVGGDYYDYFTVSETKQAIVVGDVAGHGVASGLLLAGVRSCLHLLHEEPLEPVELLAKIDRMLRQTSVQRNFVTLLYALFDHRERTVTYAAAGHPPLLRLDALTGEVEELTAHALPLGTRLGTRPQQRTVAMAENDVFTLITDGIAETVNARGDPYGDTRLRQRLAAISAERSAKEIRDTLLGDVWSFKADGVQLDDITMVVVKVK